MPYFRKKLLNILFYLKSRRHISKELAILQENGNKTIEQNLIVQNEKLKNILLHSWKYVPYYTKILEEANVVSNGKVILENFQRIAILDKDKLKKNFDSLISRDIDLSKRKPYLNTSGGSTGEPVKFMQDQTLKVLETASKWLFFTYITDYPCKHISLWGSERDIIKGKINLKQSLINFLQQKIVLNSFRMTQKNMRNYVKKINSYKPLLIEAYVQSIYSLARYIQTNRLTVHSPRGIITSAGTLYPKMKELIEEVFHCPVLNRYGSREVGDIACSCKENQGLHMNIINNYIEILDENLKPVGEGEIGQIYVTKLTNLTMPLIRYKIGDLGVPSNKKTCKCGKGFPLMEFVEGREMSAFKTKDGSIIPAEFFIHFIGVVFNKGIISKFQVIQNNFDQITIKYIIEKEMSLGKYKNQITKSIKKVMGENCKILWEKVEDIPNLPSGKYMYTYSELR